MLIQQLKEGIVDGSNCCIDKSQSQNSIFQPCWNLYVENVSPGPTMVRPIVDSGYERMSSTTSINSA